MDLNPPKMHRKCLIATEKAEAIKDLRSWLFTHQE